MPTTTTLLRFSLALHGRLLSALALILHALMSLAVGRVAAGLFAQMSEPRRLRRVQGGVRQLPRPLRS